jgi:hypothetical protein
MFRIRKWEVMYRASYQRLSRLCWQEELRVFGETSADIGNR